MTSKGQFSGAEKTYNIDMKKALVGMIKLKTTFRHPANRIFLSLTRFGILEKDSAWTV